jgi:hypothetical protein
MYKSRENLSPSCSSSEELVAYLYDEMNVAERSVFEGHLSACDSCTAEFAELSYARLGVYEWNRDEFAELATPDIVVPYEPARSSWMDAVRAFFISPAQWAMAGGAFAVFAIVAGVWFVIPNGVEVASGPVPNSSPAAVNNKPAEEIQPAAAPTANNPVVDGRDPVVQKAEPIKSEIVRTSSDENVKSPNHKPAKIDKATPQPVQAKRRAAPRLNDFEDEDDNTLRLGDLLAEVDTRD